VRSASERRTALWVAVAGLAAFAAVGCIRANVMDKVDTGTAGAGGRGGGDAGTGGSDTGGTTGAGGTGGSIGGAGGTAGSAGSSGSGGAGASAGRGGSGGSAGSGGIGGSAGVGGRGGAGGSAGSAGASGNGGAGASAGRGGSGGTAGMGGGGAAGMGGTGGSPGVVPTAPGQIVISELMHATNVVTDAVGEWVEVYNPSDTVTYNLRGCAIHDLANFYTFNADILMPPHAYRTLAIFSSGGGFTPDGTYTGVRFDNQLSDQAEILCVGTSGTLIDQFVYTDMEAMTTGRSFIVDPRHLTATDNDNPANHCVIDAVPANVYDTNAAGTVFDYGTPGKANPQCPGVTQ
jgi:hypothetical protein